MTLLVLYKLLALLAGGGLGFVAARRGWLGANAATVLGNAAFHLFVPALLFRTTARQDLAAMPWHTLAAYLVPAVLLLLAVYAWQRARAPRPGPEAATFAIAAVYGNAVQVGIPLCAALFGEAGLALHVAVVSVHGLVLLTLLTVLVESDLARAQAAAGGSRWATALATARNAVIHPVVLPVVAGLAWNLTGVGLHPVLDEALLLLGSAVVPVCLVLIGVSLAGDGVRASWRGALRVGLLKLLVMPALVLVVARWGFGLTGVPLAVLVMMAALPVGNNALIFAQRYGVLQAEATVAIVASTVAFIGSAALWLAVLGVVNG